jgi:glycosyltransferase involved in cell wall biosynthesis
MRISFFTTSAKFSGGRLAMFRHANELFRRGHEVGVWIQDEKAVVDWMALNVPLHHFRGDHPADLLASDVYVFDRARLAPILSRVVSGPVVHFCQGFEGSDTEQRLEKVWREKGLFGLSKLWKLWRRQRHTDAAYRLPTTKVVTHRHLGELLARRFGQPSHLVPLGLPPGVFVPPETRSWSGRTVLVVGPTDIGWKRVMDALNAVRLLKARLPGVKLVRVAQHPMREVERSQGVTDEYHTMIPPQEIARLYGAADALLIASDVTEGFGLPVLEALACGLPCVVTDTPAFRSFAQPADYAHFVPVGDVEGMAASLEKLLNDPGERQRLSLRGQAVAAGYSMQRSHDTMEAVLTGIAGVRRKPIAA